MVAVESSTQGAGWSSSSKVMGGGPSAAQSTRYPVSYLGSAGTTRMTYSNTSSAYMHSRLAEKGRQWSVTIAAQ